jgi:2-methylcitrate dehydratase PrpD
MVPAKPRCSVDPRAIYLLIDRESGAYGMGTTQRVASFIVNARYEDVPQPALDMIKLCLLDGIGCALYGSTRPAGRIMIGLVDELGGKPVSHVLGTCLMTNAVNAAMANGVLVHAEDFDDMGNGHQASLLVPVTLALGEEQGSSGKQLMAAYAVGMDVTAYTDISIGSDHYAKGFHKTSSVGIFGCTAAASRLLGLSEMQTRMALAISASQAAGIRANFGTMTKPFHPGNAARGGVLSAKLAARGYEGNPDVMEHRYGYFAAYGEQMAQLSHLPRHLGNPWAIMGTGRDMAKGVIIKRWPSCGITHAGATAISRLMTQQAFKADEVESVDIVTTYNPSTMAANIRWPRTALEGKFSPWYTVASLIVDGKLDLSSFTDAAYARPAVHDLLKRVNISQDSEMAGRPHRALGGQTWWDVAIKLKNGKVLVADRVEGHGEHYTWQDKEAVFAKFRSLAGVVLAAGQIDAVVNAIMDLERAKNISEIVKLLLPADADGKSASLASRDEPAVA